MIQNVKILLLILKLVLLAQTSFKKTKKFYDQMPKDIVFEIVKTLAPNFIPPKKYLLDISSSDRELMKYSNEQNAILEHALDNPRILVSGEAGTGKTLMA